MADINNVAEDLEPIVYPHVPVVKFYEPKSRRIGEKLNEDIYLMEKRMTEYRRARNTIQNSSRTLVNEIITMCSVDRKISHRFHIQSIYAALRTLPSPYCDIVEPKIKPVDFRGTLFE